MKENNQILEMGMMAKTAAAILGNASTDCKNRALLAAADSVEKNIAKILEANKKDVKIAEEKGVTGAMLDRLKLDEKRVAAIVSSLRDIAKLPDPVGRKLAEWERPNGLKISRVAVPLGVIGIIYESRPNVTADAGALALKSGNAAILRGGSESFESSKAIMECLQEGLRAAGLPEHSIQLVMTRDREAVGDMLRLDKYIDIIVPRGGKELIKRVMAESKIPVIQHLDGNCHVYIHEKADKAKALKVTENAKMRRTGICGAAESLVIDQAVVSNILPDLAEGLIKLGCEIRGDAAARKIDKRIKPATENDWDTEYLDAIISVKVVKNEAEAIEHINKHGSHHTDSIITEDKKAATEFLQKIDSAIVMHNASTQFADGGEFGMGAEIGISTGRLHARGPVGLEQLTTYKYIVEGDGQVRA